MPKVASTHGQGSRPAEAAETPTKPAGATVAKALLENKDAAEIINLFMARKVKPNQVQQDKSTSGKYQTHLYCHECVYVVSA